VERCLKFQHEMKAVMVPYKEVYKDMQKKAKLSKPPLSSPCLLSYLFLSITLIFFSQERRHNFNKHQHKRFCVY
jgi:hypothetical protein